MISFSRLLLLSAAFGGFFLSSPASAEPAKEQHFHPVKGWEVASLKPVSDYSGECVIQAEFNNGFIMRMNGSSNWVQQLNLNIRQDAFEIDKQYPVTLNVPGSEKAVISASANRGNIISVPLKGEKELFKAMRDNAVLDIAIEGNEFRFFLTGFSGAANQFERCMAGATPGQVAATKPKRTVSGTKVDAQEDLGGLGGIVRPNDDSELSVSSRDLSTSEKEFLLNESIAFEQQEVAVAREPEVITPVTPPPAQEVITDTPETIPDAAVDVMTMKLAMPAPVSPPAPRAEITEEEAVAALNASAVEAAKQRARIQVPASKPLAAQLDEEIQSNPAPVKRLSKDDTQEPAMKVESGLKMPPMLAEKEAEDIIVEVVDVAPIKSAPITPKPPEEAVVVDVPTVPTMPASDVDAASVFLDEPESSIDMPKVKVNKTTSYARADFTDDAAADIEKANASALARISALEGELESARLQKESLNDELQTALSESKQEQVSVSSENWNLERATMRYNEAERQMKKMGQQLQKERAQWAMEKKELEMMLFDPEVTSQEQLARLSKLEQELAAARAALEKATAGM